VSFPGSASKSGNFFYTRAREKVSEKPGTSREAGSKRLAVNDRLASPGAVLSRGDLRELGYERRAIDAIFRALPIIALPGYSRPLVRVADYLELVDRSTLDGRSRVRP
jgi:hypothetical protein